MGLFLFSDIMGHDDIKEHLQLAIQGDKPFHAYIFQGEVGCGKETMARSFAAGLQCVSESEIHPCGECPSCKQVGSGNHPDVIWVNRELSSIGVDEVREKIVDTMDIKPFSGPYKIYIISEADRMTEAAQNALLKTIEEPPEYGVVIMLTNNINALLPTIQSRCICLEFKPLSTATIENYLIDKYDIVDYHARTCAIFAQGNLGKAIRFVESQDFEVRKDKTLHLLRNVQNMDVADMMDVIREIGEEKENFKDYIDLMILWYRDVLILKATNDINQLVFQSEYSAISRESSNRNYEKIEEILQAFDKAKMRLKANVNFEVAMELMLLTLKQ
ncbi:MAG: DNA polymerase III subunit delta' [Eubacterium sp.]|nr:DNA polymerase III subunit delta' [Eubacterium sp.]